MSIDRENEWAEALTSDLIGEGYSRSVYQHRHRSDLVVKIIQRDSGDPYANVMEWKVWESVQGDSETCKWFAPCEYISPAGVILIQKKADKIVNGCNIESKIPAIIADVKRENFGMIGEQIVCVDYAILDLTKTRRKIVKWVENRDFWS